MQQWNGVSLLWNCGKQEADEEVYTDASGSWGCGGHWRTHWFSIPWNGPSGTPQWVIGPQEEDARTATHSDGFCGVGPGMAGKINKVPLR